MGRRIISFSIAIAAILLIIFIPLACDNNLLENLILDVERATGNIITIKIVGNGTTNPANEIVVKKGDNTPIPISATPYTDWAFIQWQGSGIVFADANSANTTVQLTGGDTTITAVFGDTTLGWPLMINNNGHGYTDQDGLQYVETGVPTSTITVYPDTGYKLYEDDWVIETGNATVNEVPPGGQNEYTITVNLPLTTIALADFARIEYTLTVTNDGNGTTTPSGSGTVYHGVPQPITATPAEGYVFKDWTVPIGIAQIEDSSSASTFATLTSGAATVQANFGKFKLFYGAWTSPATIWRCFSDWTNHQQIHSNAGLPNGIALDIANEYVYFTDDGNNKIRRCDFDGANPIDIVTGLSVPYGIALDTAHNVLYWSDDGMNQIKSINLGTMVQYTIASAPTVIFPQGMAFYNNKVFWIERQNRLIWEYDVGTQVLSSWSIAAMSSATDIAISPSQGTSGYLYCTDFSTGHIHTFDIASRTPINQFAGPWGSPKGIAIDDPNDLMYITSPYDSNVYGASILDGSVISVFSQMGRAINAIAVVPD